jgi:hypothetical protein
MKKQGLKFLLGASVREFIVSTLMLKKQGVKFLLRASVRAGLFHSPLARLRMNSESNSVRVSVSPWEKVV